MNARQQFASDTSELAEQSLGSIAVNLPGATAVFRAAKLDFCCHGNVSLIRVQFPVKSPRIGKR